MKLEQNSKMSLFSTTEIPDMFFTEYLSQTNGDYIKVYLYIVFLSKYSKEIKIHDLAKKLSLTPKVIQEAIQFLEESELITKKANTYVINDIQKIELYKLYKPKISLSPEAINNTNKNKIRSKTVESINNTYFQGLMSTAWYLDIELWFKKYEFDEQVMIALFDYCFNKSALHKNYVQTVAEAWNKSGIKTYSDLELYSTKQQKSRKLISSISKKLGRSKLTEYEEAYIEKWNIDYGYEIDSIELALKKTTTKSAPNFNYINAIISDWHDRGLKTPEEINNFMLSVNQKNKNIKSLEKKTGYKNYTQRKYDNLDSLYTDARQAQ